MKTFLIVMIAAACAAVGETLLSYGMRSYGAINLSSSEHWLTLVLSVVKNPYVFAGVVFLAIFFFLYLAALSWADLSFVLPLTAVSYLFAVFLAKYFLKEDISWYRWLGTIVIVIGIVLVSLDDNKRTTDHAAEKQFATQSLSDSGTLHDK